MSGSDPINILLIEDTVPLARVYVEYMRQEQYNVTHVETGEAALTALASAAPDAVVLDLKLPDADGLDILRHIREQAPDTSVVVITAHGSVNTAVDAMRQGAFDFIVKPFNAARLNVTLRNALERKKLTRIVEVYRKTLERDRFYDFIGASTEMQAAYRTIESVAASKASVFITGESGTGKELAADAIHRASPRRSRPFIALNCAAIPKDLLESEIFGHIRGAFTGATADRTGAASAADGGTLFLDELCEMPLDIQVKLLRFIQTGTVQPVGGTKTTKVDVRFVCATNRDPLAEVEAGRFREDLYYRLHVIPLHLPALRDREDDAVLIARHFLKEYTAEEGRSFAGFSPEVEAVVRAYDWPGNVRQLQNVVRNIVVLHDGPSVEPAMLPEPLKSHAAATISPGQPRPAAASTTLVPGGASSAQPRSAAAKASDFIIRPLWVVEKELILEALRQCGDDVPQTANLLEISPSTIYRKLQQWKAEPAGKR
ncbi:MAG: sigma-54 dependent transcriptional regulator [Rhodospirillaceae bacterium]